MVTKETLLEEKAAMETQLAQQKDAHEKLKSDYQATHGALLMINHLLAKWDEPDKGTTGETT